MFLERNVQVHFEIIASLGDQPERRAINKMMLEIRRLYQDFVILQILR